MADKHDGITPQMATISSNFVIRVRGPTAMWRVESLSPSSTIGDLKQDIETNHGVPINEQSLHQDRAYKDKPLSSSNTLKKLKLRHGSMLYIAFDTSKVNVLEQSTKRVISEDGSLVAVSLNVCCCTLFLESICVVCVALSVLHLLLLHPTKHPNIQTSNYQLPTPTKRGLVVCSFSRPAPLTLVDCRGYPFSSLFFFVLLCTGQKQQGSRPQRSASGVNVVAVAQIALDHGRIDADRSRVHV